MSPSSMYPTDRLDVNAFAKLPETVTDRFWVDVIPLAWLEYDAALKHSEWARMAAARQQADPNSLPTEAEDDMLSDVLGQVIAGWNLTDRAGQTLPQLSTDKGAWHKVPMSIINEVMTMAQAGAPIPPQNAGPSSDGSTPPSPSMPDAAAIKADDLARQVTDDLAAQAAQERAVVSPTG